MDHDVAAMRHYTPLGDNYSTLWGFYGTFASLYGYYCLCGSHNSCVYVDRTTRVIEHLVHVRITSKGWL
jgi:hypothetical protein